MEAEIKDRLSRLESSNRRLKAALYSCFCCAAVLVVMGAASTAPKVIEAEKIILRDGAGNERGQLFANENAWGLVLLNKDSKGGQPIGKLHTYWRRVVRPERRPAPNDDNKS